MCSKERNVISSKDIEPSWSYKDQSTWTNYPNFYSVSRTPINIETSKVAICNRYKGLNIAYKRNVSGIISSIDENDIPIFFPDNNDNYLYYDNRKYTLINFHYHNSSEHTINGEYFPVEVHFVNKLTENNIDYYFVLSLLLRIVPIGGLEITKNFFTQSEIKKVTYDLSIYNQLSNYKRYDFPGTLTTPPFYENVHWGLYNTNDINNFQLTINQNDYDEYIHNYINTKANVQCQYQSSRYVNKCTNFLAVKFINH